MIHIQRLNKSKFCLNKSTIIHGAPECPPQCLGFRGQRKKSITWFLSTMKFNTTKHKDLRSVLRMSRWKRKYSWPPYPWVSHPWIQPTVELAKSANGKPVDAESRLYSLYYTIVYKGLEHQSGFWYPLLEPTPRGYWGATVYLGHSNSEASTVMERARIPWSNGVWIPTLPFIYTTNFVRLLNFSKPVSQEKWFFC